MEFRIADTFTDSLARLTGEGQKAVKTTAFDLQLNPAQPGMQLHKLDQARGPHFWSVRVSRDIRLIVHKTDASLLLCYVDHHDNAYRWAERRKLETHPRTGAAQLVEIRETVQEIIVPAYVTAAQLAPPKARLFEHVAEETLLSYGVPTEWLQDVRQADEDTLLQLADHLPSEAAEALLELASGGKPQAPKPTAAVADPFEHPDAQRRFRVMTNVEELTRALEYPWEKWTIFLHPAQRQLVEGDHRGPARVCGSAGTGKAIVALHRAVFLARTNPDARVLLATFSDTLANALRTRSIFDRVRSQLQSRDFVTYAGMFSRLATQLATRKRTPFDFAVVDEAQDVSVAQLRFLAAFGADQPDRLFFAGDLGQRIFQQPFSWKALGVDIRGRSLTLHIHYRTSHQIRTQADRLLGPELSDVDGNIEQRMGTISVFNGPRPTIQVFESPEDESQKVGTWLSDRANEGVMPHEMGVFVRSPAELDRARAAVENTGLRFKVLDENVETTSGHVSISTMHLAKGLEFRAVVVMACDDEIIPLQARIETAADDADLEEVYTTERHLLYVACTRARDHPLVTSVDPASEFLDDLRM
jgi:hypothetical protein